MYSSFIFKLIKYFNKLLFKRWLVSIFVKMNTSSIYYFWKSGAGRFPFLMPDSIDDFRQTSANAVDGEVRKERKDVT